MLLVILFGCILSVSEVSAVVDTMPDVSSVIPSSDESIPENITIKQENITFREYVPVGCFCDQSVCHAQVKAVELPVIGLLTKDGNNVKSLEAQAHKGDLIFVMMIDPKSTLGMGNYLEKVSYWSLADGPHRILPQSSLKLKITLKSSLTEIHHEQAQFHLEAKLIYSLFGSLKLTFDSETTRQEEITREADYEFPPSSSGQIAGVYQLVQDYVIRPTTALAEYVEHQKADIYCTSYIIFKKRCGILQFLPPFQHKTFSFQQYAHSVEGNNIDSISNGNQLGLAINVPKDSTNQARLNGRNKSIRITLFFIGLILLGGFAVAIVYLVKQHYWQSRYTVVAQDFPLE